MASVREQIIQALLDVLAAIADPEPVTIYRMRDIPIEQLPCLNVVDGTDRVIEELTGCDWRQMSVAIQGSVGGKADEIGSKVNELHALVADALKTDRTLGGLAVNMQLGDIDAIDIAADDPEVPNGAFSMPLLIDYWTKPGSLSELAP